MSVLLTHIGEAVTKGLLEAVPSEFLCEYFDGRPIAFHQEVPLEKFNGRGFDGKGKVDLVAQLSNSGAIAIEVKLGTTNMNQGRIRGWLGENLKQECTHKGTRWGGNMIRFFDRWEGLTVKQDENALRLQEKWILVIRRSVYNRWDKNKILPPTGELLSKRCVPLAFEDLVDAVGCTKFNEIVHNLMPDDPCSKWILPSLHL